MLLIILYLFFILFIIEDPRRINCLQWCPKNARIINGEKRDFNIIVAGTQMWKTQTSIINQRLSFADLRKQVKKVITHMEAKHGDTANQKITSMFEIRY